MPLENRPRKNLPLAHMIYILTAYVKCPICEKLFMLPRSPKYQRQSFTCDGCNKSFGVSFKASFTMETK